MPNQLFKNKSFRFILGIFLGIFIFLMLVSLLVYVEKDSDQVNISNFQNGLWFAVVTLTSVGFGDLFPTTIYGRMISYIFIIGSLGIYGILIGQFTTLMATIKENKKLGYNGTSFQDHAVIIGWSDFGKLVLEQLIGVGKDVAVVTNNRDDIDLIRDQYKQKNIFTLYTDFSSYEMLRKVNIENSSIVFVNLNDDTEKLVYILNMKKVYPKLEYVVTLDNGDLKNTFHSAGVTNTISKHELSSKLLASYMFEPDVASYSESIMSFAKSDGDHDIKQLLVTHQNPYVGRTYDEVFFELKRKFNTVLIGITKQDSGGQKRLLKNPDGDLKIGPGDYLILILNGKSFHALQKVFAVDEGYIREKTA